MQLTALLSIVVSASAFTLAPRVGGRAMPTQANHVSMIEITKGVEFDTIAREWRMKW